MMLKGRWDMGFGIIGIGNDIIAIEVGGYLYSKKWMRLHKIVHIKQHVVDQIVRDVPYWTELHYIDTVVVYQEDKKEIDLNVMISLSTKICEYQEMIYYEKHEILDHLHRFMMALAM